MRILITNDDGINAPGIRVLAEWARGLGEVTVIAPKTEQSGKSHAIDFTRPIEIKKVEYMEGVTAYSMDSTPADCIRFAHFGLKEEYDLVLSGINRGFNLGKDIVYSGTAGAIFEAGRLGINAIAFSTHPKSFDSAAKYLDKAYGFITDNNLFDLCRLFNVNIPDGEGEIRITRQGGIYFHDDFVYTGNDIWEQTGYIINDNEGDATLDTDSVRDGFISITPLLSDRTNMPVYEKIKVLNNKN
jgi:5'-nucleotidase